MATVWRFLFWLLILQILPQSKKRLWSWQELSVLFHKLMGTDQSDVLVILKKMIMELYCLVVTEHLLTQTMVLSFIFINPHNTLIK
jgi:hypothetical protein